MSSRDVYQATNDGQVPVQLIPMEGAETQDEKSYTQQSQRTEANKPSVASNAVVDNYVAPRLPDQPVPIRTPAQVMRIWIAPYEDTNGDLNTPGFVYSEIEPRRWVIGEPMKAVDPILKPLVVKEPVVKTQQKRSNQPKAPEKPVADVADDDEMQRRDIAQQGASQPNQLPKSN